MANTQVSEELCEARRAETDRRLESIERDVSETRQGVGKLLRVILEGNGQPAMTVRLSTCEKSVSALEETRKERKRTNMTLWIAIVGWVVTIGLAIFDIV